MPYALRLLKVPGAGVHDFWSSLIYLNYDGACRPLITGHTKGL